MSTLALKYRPRLLSDLVGQEASVRALSNALRRAQPTGRIHHQAFLFAGVRGTGKTSTARIMARALNCEKGPTPDPCGGCDACLAAEEPDRNLDVIEIDAASRSSVEDARALREQVQTRPAFCRYRVYIIDEVHMMSRSAFDALLKILEEPPPHAVFVLATTELQDVPDTIKSRVQIYPFRLIPVGQIESRLKHVCNEEKVPFDEGSLRLLAEAGQGSMRDALTTLDRVIAAGEGRVLEQLVREQLGIVPAVRIQAIMDALLAGNAGTILDECRALNELGTDWTSFWRELMLAFRSRLESEVTRNTGPQNILRLARMLQLLLARERDLRDSSLPQVVVELALVTASQLPHLAPLDTLLRPGLALPQGQGTSAAMGQATVQPISQPGARATAQPAAPTQAPAQTPAPAPQSPARVSHPPEAPRPSAPMPTDMESLRRACAEAIRSVPTLPRGMSSLPHMATSVQFSNGNLHFQFPAQARPSAELLAKEATNPHLLEALGIALPGMTKITSAMEAGNATRPEDILKEDEAFQRLLQKTGGEVVEIRREEIS